MSLKWIAYRDNTARAMGLRGEYKIKRDTNGTWETESLVIVPPPEDERLIVSRFETEHEAKAECEREDRTEAYSNLLGIDDA